MKTYNALDFIKQKARTTEPLLRYEKKEELGLWQQKAKAKLEELLGLPLAPCRSFFEITGNFSKDGYEQIDFSFQSEEGFFVNGNLLVPFGTSKPNATVICLQGHSTGKHISMGQAKYLNDAQLISGGRDFAVRAVKEGFCAAVIDQRYMGETGQRSDGAPDCVGINAAMAAILMGRCAIGERVWDVKRLIDILFLYFAKYGDKDKLICMGNSGGGTTAFYVSCLDDRIKLAMPSCAVCNFDDSIIDLHHCSCNYVPGIRKYFDMGDIGCLIAPRRLIIVCGIQDDIFPLKGVEDSYERIREVYKTMEREGLCRLVKGKGGHQFYPDEAWPIVHELLSREK